jgi:hypothetical protein
MTRFNRLLVLVLLLAGTAWHSARAAGLHSGIYENLLLAVNADGLVQGVYAASNGQGVTESCVIYFTGQAAGDAAIPVRTWDFEAKHLAGTLTPDDPDVDLGVPNAASYGGCGMAPAPDGPHGTPFSLTRITGWTALEQIKAPKAYFHAAPADGQPSRVYVVKDDIVGVLGAQTGWLQVEYIPPADLSKSVKGWIAAGEAAPLSPP